MLQAGISEKGEILDVEATDTDSNTSSVHSLTAVTSQAESDLGETTAHCQQPGARSVHTEMSLTAEILGNLRHLSLGQRLSKAG